VKFSLYTANPRVVLDALESKFSKLLPKRQRIRSTGVILHNLTREEEVPRDLFGKQEKELKSLVVEEMVDKIRHKHGRGAIKLAASLKKK